MPAAAGAVPATACILAAMAFLATAPAPALATALVVVPATAPVVAPVIAPVTATGGTLASASGLEGVNPLLPGAGLRLQDETPAGEAPSNAAEEQSTPSHRAYVLPVLLSALVPGAGEISTGHWLRGLPFVALDVATWLGYVHYDQEGEDWRTKYEQFADEHWQYSGDRNGNGNIDVGEVNGWQEWLPLYYDGQYGANYDFWDPNSPHNCSCPYISKEEDRQHYYENIGKYLYYYPGWDDWAWSGDPATADSQGRRQEYAAMRIESNDNFDTASNLLVVAMVTRLASVVQTVFLVRADQRALEVRPMRVSGRGFGLRLALRY